MWIKTVPCISPPAAGFGPDRLNPNLINADRDGQSEHPAKRYMKTLKIS